MLKIRNVEFKEKFIEINIRQRMYQGINYVTLMITAEFYPNLVNGQIVSGMIEAKVDMKDVHCVDDFVSKKLDGEIGSVTVSVNNDGIWEHQTQEEFQIEIKNRLGRELEFLLTLEDVVLDSKGTLVSLYTTSSSEEELSKVFELEDFYDSVVEKEIGNKKIIKYFARG